MLPVLLALALLGAYTSALPEWRPVGVGETAEGFSMGWKISGYRVPLATGERPFDPTIDWRWGPDNHQHTFGTDRQVNMPSGRPIIL